VHFVGVVDPAGQIDRLVVIAALDHPLILGSAAVIVKDDPIRGHAAFMPVVQGPRFDLKQRATESNLAR
jgi:hypothetical protein